MTGVVRNRALTVNLSTLVTMDTGPERARVDSGLDDDQYSLTGAPSPSLSAPVSWGLTVEAEASTELCANLACGLTVVT